MSQDSQLTEDNGGQRPFLPTLMLTSSESAQTLQEIPDILRMRDPSGRPVFDLMHPDAAADDRSAAIAQLKRSADQLPRFDAAARDRLLRQHLAATNMRFHRYALEDNSPHADDMGDYIVTLFRAAAASDDEGVRTYQMMLVKTFNDRAQSDYDRVNPAARNTPNLRAQTLLTRLQTANPGLFADLRPRLS